MFFDNTFWAFVSFVIFMGILVYMGVPKMLRTMLDERIRKIQTDLNEARELREEAQALLAEYERKRKDAETEAADIVTAAQEEAKRTAAEAEASLQDLIARRTKAVEEKIAQAEQHALAEVRARSADVATDAARIILTRQMSDKGDAVVETAIKDVAARLN